MRQVTGRRAGWKSRKRSLIGRNAVFISPPPPSPALRCAQIVRAERLGELGISHDAVSRSPRAVGAVRQHERVHRLTDLAGIEALPPHPALLEIGERDLRADFRRLVSLFRRIRERDGRAAARIRKVEIGAEGTVSPAREKMLPVQMLVQPEIEEGQPPCHQLVDRERGDQAVNDAIEVIRVRAADPIVRPFGEIALPCREGEILDPVDRAERSLMQVEGQRV